MLIKREKCQPSPSISYIFKALKTLMFPLKKKREREKSFVWNDVTYKCTASSV